MDTDEYPSFNQVSKNEYFSIKNTDLKNLISRSIFSVAMDDSRPILRGVLFEVSNSEVKAVALDGYRLALAKTPVISSNFSGGVIIPSKSLSEVSKLIGDNDEAVNVFVDKKYIMIDNGETKVISRILEGEFLNYKQIISNDFETMVIINRSQIMNALDRASTLSKVGQNNLVKFDIKENNMLISSNSDIGNIKENVNISVEGKDLFIAFNARYFMEAFRVISDEFVKLKFNSASNPCIITPVDDTSSYLFLILPVRIMG